MTETVASSEEVGGYQRACAVSDIPDSNALRVVLGDVGVAVVRSDGEYYAIHDVCSHAYVFLSEGEVFDGVIDCWLHGSEFDLRTGAPLTLPATEPVPTYPVKVEGDDIYVNLDEPIRQES